MTDKNAARRGNGGPVEIEAKQPNSADTAHFDQRTPSRDSYFEQELRRLVRERKDELGATFPALDDASGLGDSHTSHILTPHSVTGRRAPTTATWGLLLTAIFGRNFRLKCEPGGPLHSLLSTRRPADHPKQIRAWRVKADDDAARDKIQNLNFAIEEAQQHLDAALAAEQEVEDDQRREQMSDLADGLIELDVKIIKTLRAVHGLLEQRTAAVEDITQVGAGMLGMMQIAQLRNDENIIDAVYDVLSAHLGHRRTAPVGAAAKLISHDCSIFGKPPPMPAAPMTAAEKERRRALRGPIIPFSRVV